MFKITQGKGFQMTFENGWTVSVQFGSCNYGSNYDVPFGTRISSATTAEIAAWDADGKWHDFGGDTVQGWCSPDQVARFIQQIAKAP